MGDIMGLFCQPGPPALFLTEVSVVQLLSAHSHAFSNIPHTAQAGPSLPKHILNIWLCSLKMQMARAPPHFLPLSINKEEAFPGKAELDRTLAHEPVSLQPSGPTCVRTGHS